MNHFAVIVSLFVAFQVRAAPCEEPAPIDGAALEKPDLSLVTWSRTTAFKAYPPTVPLPSKADLERRRATLEARNPGFTVGLDTTGRLVTLSSARMPCAILEARQKDGNGSYRTAAEIEPWFDELAWALEQRNWDALGHAAAPTRAARSTASITYERAPSDGGFTLRFVVRFLSDPRPTPRAGRDLASAALRRRLEKCQLEAVRTTCAPCAPPGPCTCARIVRSRRACDAHVVFETTDAYVDQNGARRFVRVARPTVETKGLREYEDAPWELVGAKDLDAVTGAELAKTLSEGDGLVDIEPTSPFPGLVP